MTQEKNESLISINDLVYCRKCGNVFIRKKSVNCPVCANLMLFKKVNKEIDRTLTGLIQSDCRNHKVF